MQQCASSATGHSKLQFAVSCPIQADAISLFIKTIERAHMPSKWWEKIRLPSDYSKALDIIDQRLPYWNKAQIHKCKQRLTRLTQVALRTKRLLKEEARLGERLVPKLAPKVRRREETRERKAEAAAKVERAIERELLERLRSGAYGDRPLNADERVWRKVLNAMEKGGEVAEDEDLDEGIEEEVEYEYETEKPGQEVEYVSDIEGESEDEMEDFEDWLGGHSADEEDDTGASDDDDEDDDEEDEEEASDEDETAQLKKALGNLKRKRPAAPPSKPNKKSSKGPKRNIEYEIEKEPPPRQLVEA